MKLLGLYVYLKQNKKGQKHKKAKLIRLKAF